jgi:hypothetical protein
LLRKIADVLGSAAFKPVKGDMTGNIKVRIGIYYAATEPS